MAKVQLERVESLDIRFVDEVKEVDVVVDAIFGDLMK